MGLKGMYRCVVVILSVSLYLVQRHKPVRQHNVRR